MSPKFITGEPALLIGKTLVIADLHIGIESEYMKSGITVPSQIEQMTGKIDRLIQQTSAKKIVFLGDIKNQVPGVSFQELRELPEFFSHFSCLETHIVLGNHDSEIPALVENVKIHGTSALSFSEKKVVSRRHETSRHHEMPILRSQRKGFNNGIKIHGTDGFRLGSAYITHGHAWPKKEFLSCKYIIVSHTHPLIEIKDRIGYKFFEKVWVKASFNLEKLSKKYKKKISKAPEIILMPAFNELSGGAALNVETGRRQRLTSETFLGPITQLVDKKQTDIFLLDGTYLGKLDSLRK